MSLRSTIRQIQANDSDQKAIQEDKSAFISKWKSDIEELFSFIRKELVDFINDGLLVLASSQSEIKEENLGSYTVPLLKIRAGSRDLVARPIARITTGGAGRVDLMRSDRPSDRDRIYIVRRVEESGDLRWYIEEKKTDPLETIMPMATRIFSPRSYQLLWGPTLEKAIDFLLRL